MLAPRLLLLPMVLAATAFGQNLRVIPVPYLALDPTVPHAAFNGHRTILKAIARGGDGSYAVEWDFQGDGTFDFATARTDRYDLSVGFTFPNTAADVTYNAVVRVTSNGQTVTATYPVRIYADVPANPSNANDRQLQVMRNVAVDDGLWFLHTQLTRAGNEEDPLTGAQITATLPGATTFTSGAFLEALGRNQHPPAFPAAYLGVMPDPAQNAARWATDPYAEDAARLVNGLLTQAGVVAVAAVDEGNLTGFYPEQSAAPIPGTDDGIGLYIGADLSDRTTGYAGAALRGLAVARLSGYVAQVGDPNRVLGRRFEFIVQQLVDGLVWAQNDGGSYPGSWYFWPNANSDLLGEIASGTIEVIEALWLVEQTMKSQGVIVPNLVKARLASYILANANTCPGGGTGGTMYSSYDGVCDFAVTSAHVFALGWLGANAFSTTDTRLAFPSYSFGITRASLRVKYDSSLVFIANTYATGAVGSLGWDTGFVEAGDFFRVDGRGDHYSMLHWARAARAVEPEIVTFGTRNFARDFAGYLIRNQATGGGWNWTYSGSLGPNNDNAVGPNGRAAWAILTLTPDELMPVAWATASPATAPEGTSITFTALSTVPGGTVTWSMGNGDTRTGSPLVYAFPDNGTFDVSVTVTTPGGTSVGTVSVAITNAAPQANAGLDLTVFEGDVVPFTGSVSDPGLADTHTFFWAFGDTQTAATLVAPHVYVDNGVFNASFRATDDDGATTVDLAVVTVRNVAPTITSTPGTSATEGAAWTYTMTFTDPGAVDTHTCSTTTAPAGRTLTGCAWQWTPTFEQALQGNNAFRLCVTDDDGDVTCQSFAVTAAVIDTDADGLPDSWETANFGDLAALPNADPDLDGLTNLQELSGVTDPNVFDGPSTPAPTTPACGARVSSARPTLTVTNATDPQGTPLLRYEFELFDDAALTSLVISASDVPAGATTTSWRVPVVLQEDTRYYWRARTRDASTNGPWNMPACSFLVDAVNSLPGAPRLDSPALGASVSTLQPSLVVGNAVDPEGDALTYEFELSLGDTRVGTQQGVTEGTGTTSWQTPALQEDTDYTWRARAQSAGGPGAWSETGRFRVNTTNAAPPSPLLVSPQQGTTVETLSPTLVFFPVADPDGDSLVFDWELAADERFASALSSGVDVTVTQVVPSAPLTEDSRSCWRVRADDGQAHSEWVRACFKVSTADGPPGVPTAFNPSNGGAVATLTPVYSWATAVDPEGAPVFYDVEVKEGAAVVASFTGVGGNAAVGREPLTDGKTYTWRVRATTGAEGPASEFSSESSFEVRLPKQEIADAGTDPAKAPTGCGCALAPGGWLLLAVPLLWRRRRRAPVRSGSNPCLGTIGTS